jgi:hypothetical protein
VTALSPLILGKVKPLRKTKADSLSVCSRFIRFIHYYIPRLVPALPTQGHKGIPFRYTSWTLLLTLVNSTQLYLPAQPCFRGLCISNIYRYSYHTYQLGTDHISIDNSVVLPNLLCLSQHHSNTYWIASLQPSRPSLRAWTRKGSLHPSAK